MRRTLAWLLCALSSLPAVALAPKEEVEVTSGAVTALSCALEAQAKNDLLLLNACPYVEAQHGIVVFDVVERQIYRVSMNVPRHLLEAAFGGGSIDLEGVVLFVDKKTGVATLDVVEFSVTKKPKAGSFKGCL